MILFALAAFAACLFPAVAPANEEVCAVCDRQVVVSGQFNHERGPEGLMIAGAPRRSEEAFREEIYGTNFTLSVPNLPAGQYTVLIGLAEMVFTNAGERVFDITCGSQTLAVLGRGRFFGVVCALSGTPCMCSIAALEKTTITFLPQKAFNDFIKDYPILRQLPLRLAQEGMLVDRGIFVGDVGIPGLT